MSDSHESFEDILRSIAQEVGRSVEHAVQQIDVDEIAGSVGVDPARAREWIDNAASWLRGQAEHVGDEAVFRTAHQPAPTQREDRGEDPLRGAGPHPLDTPTEEQGLALAALDSGRWIVEPGSEALAAHGEGPGPSDALGLVRELRTRDWIASDGALTGAGRHALNRWLDAADLQR